MAAGRKPGRRSDPNYTRLTALVKLETYKRLKHALIDADEDISDVVEALVVEWLEKKEKERSPDNPQ